LVFFLKIQAYRLRGGPLRIADLSCIPQDFNLIEILIDWQDSTTSDHEPIRLLTYRSVVKTL